MFLQPMLSVTIFKSIFDFRICIPNLYITKTYEKSQIHKKKCSFSDARIQLWSAIPECYTTYKGRFLSSLFSVAPLYAPNSKGDNNLDLPTILASSLYTHYFRRLFFWPKTRSLEAIFIFGSLNIVVFCHQLGRYCCAMYYLI